MSKKLWQPSLIVKKNSNLFAFENYISKKLKIKFNRNYKIENENFLSSDSVMF